MKEIMAGSGFGNCSTANTAICYCANGAIEEHCALPQGNPANECQCYGSYIVSANWGITQWCCDFYTV
jgi:hypothetical protein